MRSWKVWLEFEEYDPFQEWDPYTETFNMNIHPCTTR